MQWSFIASNKTRDALLSSSDYAAPSAVFYSPKSADFAAQYHLCTPTFLSTPVLLLQQQTPFTSGVSGHPGGTRTLHHSTVLWVYTMISWLPLTAILLYNLLIFSRLLYFKTLIMWLHLYLAVISSLIHASTVDYMAHQLERPWLNCVHYISHNIIYYVLPFWELYISYYTVSAKV